MSGSVEVSSDELFEFQKNLQSIADDFEQVDDKCDFDVATFGSERVVSALQKFTKNWTDGRDKIRKGVESLAGQVGAAAETYRNVEQSLKDSMTCDPTQNPNGSQNGGSQTPTGPQPVTANDPNGSGSNGGGTSPATPQVPNPPSGGLPGDVPGGVIGGVVGGGAIGAIRNPGVSVDPVPAPPPQSGGVPLTPPGSAVGPIGKVPTDPGIMHPLPMPAPSPLPLTPGPGGGYEPPTAEDRQRMIDELRNHSTSLRDIAADLRDAAANMPPGPERDLLLVEADRIEREAQITDELIARQIADDELVYVNPGDGRFIGVHGPDDPNRVIVNVGEPGGAGDYVDSTRVRSQAILDELRRTGHDDVGVVSWQDYGTGSGPATPEHARLQGAANLNAFVGQLNDAGYPADKVSVMGYGVGGDVADTAAQHGMGASTVVTPTSMGMTPPPPIPHAPAPAAPADDTERDDAPAPATSSSGRSSSGMIMGVMALSQIGNALFFKGRSMEDATKAAAEGREADEAPLRTW